MNDTKAIGYLEHSMVVHQKFKQQSPLIHCKLILATAYIKFGKPEKVIKLLRDAEQQSKIMGTSETFILIEATYIYYFQTQGDWKQAFEHLQKRIAYLEKSNLADRNGAVSKLNIAYETDKKDKLLVTQQTNIRLHQLFLEVVGLLLIFTIFISYFLFKLYQKNKIISHRNAILLQEQNHRVKNNLQVVSSLLSLQANQLEDGKAKQAVDESQLRIETMTILHQQLYDNQDALDKIDMESFISELTETILQSYGICDIEKVFKITFKSLNADKSVFIGLLINELVSNACKYAFQNNEYCFIEICLFEKGNNIYLTIRDNGKQEILFQANSLEFKTKNQSFGMKLVNMMVLQLNGNINYSYKGGSIFKVKFRA